MAARWVRQGLVRGLPFWMGEGRGSQSCSMKGGQAKGAAAAQTRYIDGRGDEGVQQWRGEGTLIPQYTTGIQINLLLS